MKGLQEILRNLDKVERDLEKKQVHALKNEANRIMADSKEHYAPEDEGDLIEEGAVSEPVKTSNGFEIAMSYGGPKSKDYAVPLHEHPSRSSPPTWKGLALEFTKPGTGEKYLERPLMKAIDGMVERLAADIKLGE